MTVASVSTFSAFVDLGIGNTLLTRLTESYSNEDLARSRSLVLNAYVVASLSAVVLGVVAAIGLTLLHGSTWSESQGIPPEEVLGIVAVTIAAFILTIPIAMIGRVRYATGAVAEENAWQALTSISAAAAFIACVWLGGGPVWAVASAAFAVPFVGLVSTGSYFMRKSSLLPGGLRPTLHGVLLLLSMGIPFLAIGATTALAQNADLFIASSLLGLSDAAQLSVSVRVTGMLSTFFTLVALPLWPAAGSALAAHDYNWVRRTTIRMVVIAVLVVGVPGLLLATVFLDLVADWVGQGAIAPTAELLLALTAWNLMLAASSPFFMVQNAGGVLAPQLVGWLLFLGGSLAGKVALAPSHGLLAFPVVSMAAFVVCVVPAVAIGYRRVFRTRSTFGVSG